MLGVIGILGLLAGAAIGGLLGFLLAERRCRGRDAQAHTALAVAEQRCGDLSRQLENERHGTEALRAQLTSAEKQQASLSAQLAAAQQNLAEQKQLLDDAQAKLTQAFAS